MNNTRIFWIIWCSMWALGWMTVGWLIFPINLIMIPASLLAILIPVGTEPPNQLPPGQEPWRNQLR